MVPRVLRALSVVIFASSTIVVGLAGSSQAAAGPKLKVTPSTNLKNGSVVMVSGTGFKPKDVVYITECLAKATGENGCRVDLATIQSFTINAKGLLPLSKFKLYTGKIGNGTCGTTKANLRKCAVSVGSATGSDSAIFIVTFALPKKK